VRCSMRKTLQDVTQHYARDRREFYTYASSLRLVWRRLYTIFDINSHKSNLERNVSKAGDIPPRRERDIEDPDFLAYGISCRLLETSNR
jgi:hypothetical protein